MALYINKEKLLAYGLHVGTATSGPEAIDKIKGNSVDSKYGFRHERFFLANGFDSFLSKPIKGNLEKILKEWLPQDK